MNLIIPGLHQATQTPPPPPANPFDLEPVKRSLASYTAKIDAMDAQAEALEVTDDASQALAVEMAGQVKRIAKAIEDARKGFVAAPNGYVKDVNALAGMFKPRFDAIERGLKAKMVRYSDHEEMERRKAEAAARQAAIEAQRKIDEEARLAREAAEREAAEARAKAEEAAKAGREDAARLAEVAAAEQAKAQVVVDMPTVQVQAPVIPHHNGPVRTAAGTASTKKVWKFEVESVQDVPREYLVVDEKAIRQAVKSGVRNIPGVRIYETSEIAIRA